jgi:polysaccharide biosynthesis transport protein
VTQGGSDQLRTTHAEAARSAAPGGSPNHWHFVDYLRLLSKRRWTAMSAFLAVMLTAAVLTYTATPLYEARAQLLIEAESQNIVTFQEVVQQEMTSVEYYTTQYKILQSRALARVTMEQLKLWDHPELTPRAAEGSGPGLDIQGQTARLLRVVEGGLIRVLGPQRAYSIYDAPKNNEPAGADETRAQTLAIQSFLGKLTITPIRNSRLVDVKFRSTDPELAATVANALSGAYIDRILQFKLSASKEAADWLANQLSEQREKVLESQRALQQYREQNSTLSTEDAQLTQKLNDLNALLTRARTERLQKELVLRQVEAGRSDRNALRAFPEIASHPGVQLATAELAEFQRREAQLAREFGDKWPDLQTVRAAIKTARDRLDDEIDRAVIAVDNAVATARAHEDGLAAALQTQKDEALARNRKAIGFQSLERELASNEQIFDTLMQRAKETNISSQLRTNNIRLADEANAPTAPVWPDKRRNLLFALFGGVVLGIALAFAAEYMDNKLKLPEEIRDDLGLRCLGIVPKVPVKAGNAPMLNNGVPPGFTEAFRAIRTNVIFSFADLTDDRKMGKSLVITSTAPSEGKTLVATNLAAGLALAGYRVILIDGDMRRPRVHSAFGCPQEPGLSNVVANSARPSEAIRKSPIPGLWLMPSGQIPPNPAELLSARRFRDVLEALSKQFDWLIIDSPPTMAVIDASVVAHTVAGVLFVVAGDKTSRPAAMKAMEQLDAAKSIFLGAVLNGIDLKRNAFYYSPYYRREYGDYYSRPA